MINSPLTILADEEMSKRLRLTARERGCPVENVITDILADAFDFKGQAPSAKAAPNRLSDPPRSNRFSVDGVLASQIRHVAAGRQVTPRKAIHETLMEKLSDPEPTFFD